MDKMDEIMKRVVIYPVNVGDTVYVLLPGKKAFAEAVVKSISHIRKGAYDYFYILASYKGADGKEKTIQRAFGMTAFSSSEDAEREICGK